MKALARKFWEDETGLTTVEYALLLALVAIAAITAWSTLGQKVNNTVATTSANLP
jgi:pilus assembly protein Flp/PilA